MMSASIVKSMQDISENSGSRFRAPTAREGSAASTRLIRQRPRYPCLAVLLCCLASPSLPGQAPQAPYDVQKLRANHRREEAKVEEFFRKQIPKEAIRPDGSVDTSNPEWQKMNKQAARTQRRLRERYAVLEGRPGARRGVWQVRCEVMLSPPSRDTSGSCS